MAHLRLVLSTITVLATSAAAAQTRDTVHASRTSCAGAPSADTTVYSVSQVSEVPDIRHLDPPTLSRKIVQGANELRVVLELVVNADGTVDSNSVAVAAPTKTALDAAAVEVAKKATFWPGCRFDDAVRVRVQFPVHYAGAIIITR